MESFVTKRRDRKAALKFLKKTMRNFGAPNIIVTDKLRSHGAAIRIVGNAKKQENRALDEQPRGKFPPAISTKRAGDAPLPTNAKSAEIRRCPRFCP